MAWLDDRLRDHPKIVRASAPAFKVWALALCYCSAHGTEGRLDEAVKALAAPKRIVDELVDLRLWDREPDGLWVHDWQEHNEKRDQAIDERRKAARERQRRHRERVRQERDQQASPQRDTDVTVTRDTGVTDSVTSLAGARPRHARDHDHDQEVTTAATRDTTPHDPAAAALELHQRLTDIGIDPALAAQHHNPLITAWLDLADTEARDNPAGFVIAGVRSGKPPSPRVRAQESVSAVRSTLDLARELYASRGDLEAVEDWLAGLTRVPSVERARILEQLRGELRDEEPVVG